MAKVVLAVALALAAPVGLAAPGGGDNDGELAPPVRLEAGGKPIDTEVGHAAPCVVDWDGDGVKDLLVGQFGGGLLWIFRNEGTNGAPKLAAGTKFKDGAQDGVIPAG